MRPIYVALYKGLQGVKAHSAATTRNTRGKPLLLAIIVTRFFLHVFHNTWDLRLYVAFPKNQAMMV